MGLKEDNLFLEIVCLLYFGVSSEAAMGGVGAQRPVWHANDPKKTGARSARARTRGQNPLVVNTTVILTTVSRQRLLLVLLTLSKICMPGRPNISEAGGDPQKDDI